MVKRFSAVVGLILVSVLAVYYFRSEQVEVEPATHRRLISLAPSLTELIFELGAGKELVGVTTYCTFPPATAEIEKVGGFIDLNLEKVTGLKPDLVLAHDWSSSRTVERLRELGLRVVEVITPQSVDEIYLLIRDTGQAIDRGPEAEKLIAGLRLRVEAIVERSRKFPRRPTFYVEIDLPSWTVGQGSTIDDAVYLCGGLNIFHDVNRAAIQASREVILEKDPEFILSLHAAAVEIARRPGWSTISAVRRGRIIDDIPRDLLSHANHRLIEGMEALQQRMEEAW